MVNMTMMNILASNARMALLHSTRRTVPSMRSDLIAIIGTTEFQSRVAKASYACRSAHLVSHFTVQPQHDAATFPVPTGGSVEQVSPAIIDRTGRLHVGGSNHARVTKTNEHCSSGGYRHCRRDNCSHEHGASSWLASRLARRRLARRRLGLGAGLRLRLWRSLLWRAICLCRGLRHAAAMGDQSLGPPRLQVGSRLLLSATSGAKERPGTARPFAVGGQIRSISVELFDWQVCHIAHHADRVDREVAGLLGVGGRHVRPCREHKGCCTGDDQYYTHRGSPLVRLRK
jgi:hypothetical protein